MSNTLKTTDKFKLKKDMDILIAYEVIKYATSEEQINFLDDIGNFCFGLLNKISQDGKMTNNKKNERENPKSFNNYDKDVCDNDFIINLNELQDKLKAVIKLNIPIELKINGEYYEVRE